MDESQWYMLATEFGGHQLKEKPRTGDLFNKTRLLIIHADQRSVAISLCQSHGGKLGVSRVARNKGFPEIAGWSWRYCLWKYGGFGFAMCQSKPRAGSASPMVCG